MSEKTMKDIKILPKEFFLNSNVAKISQDLLGKILVTKMDQVVTMGRIVETEAYDGSMDRACHAFFQKRTERTEVMFKEGGRSYVYLCYGIHHLFNIVTHEPGKASAVLIRALEPIEGLDEMKLRRKQNNELLLANGPGKVAQAMGITREYNDTLLYEEDSPIWIGEHEERKEWDIVRTTRIGVDYAGEDAQLPWRFYIDNNPYISKK